MMWLFHRFADGCWLCWLRASIDGGGLDVRPTARERFCGLGSLVVACLDQGRRPGLGPAAEVPFFESPKKGTPKKGDPAARVPTRPVGVWGSLRCSVLGCAAELAAFFELRSNSCGKLDNDARVLRHALTPGPALLGTVRRGWKRAPYGPLLRSARCAVAALGLGRAIAPEPSAARTARVTDPRRSCVAAAVFVPAPHPCWLRREAQGMGWVRVPKDTRTSCSSSSRMFERSSKNAASSATPPKARASQVAPIARQGDGGRRLGVAFSLVTFSWRRKRKLLRRRAHTPASALSKSTHPPQTASRRGPP
jgi:hypothetical protein